MQSVVDDWGKTISSMRLQCAILQCLHLREVKSRCVRDNLHALPSHCTYSHISKGRLGPYPITVCRNGRSRSRPPHAAARAGTSFAWARSPTSVHTSDTPTDLRRCTWRCYTRGDSTPTWWQYTPVVAVHPHGGSTHSWWQYTSVVAVHLHGGSTHPWWQ